jgi:hypothetical protein
VVTGFVLTGDQISATHISGDGASLDVVRAMAGPGTVVAACARVA